MAVNIGAFGVPLPRAYYDYLNNGGSGRRDRSTVVRLALMTKLSELDPLTFSVADRRGSIAGEINVQPSRLWYGELLRKAEELKSNQETVARACICLLLEDLAEAEGTTLTE